MKADGTELAGIDNDSIDYLICYYTWCAINSDIGKGVLALMRFYDVLKPGGRLYIGEECPVHCAEGTAQKLWGRKWAVLGAAQILANESIFTEIEPETLSRLCRIVGFKHVEYEKKIHRFPIAETLPFFQKRMDHLLSIQISDTHRKALKNIMKDFLEDACEIGEMEAPYYELWAEKLLPAS